MRKFAYLALAVATGMLPAFAPDRTAFELASAVGTIRPAGESRPGVLVVVLDAASETHPELAGLPRSQWPRALDVALVALADSPVEVIGFDLVWPLAGPDAPGWLAALRQLSRDGRIVLGYLHDGERVIAPHPAQVAALGGHAHLAPLNLPDDRGRIRRIPATIGDPPRRPLAPELAARLGAGDVDRSALLRPWQSRAVGVVSLADLLECGVPEGGHRVALFGAWLPYEDRHPSVLRLQPRQRRAVTRHRCGTNPAPELVHEPVPGVLLHALGVLSYTSGTRDRRLPFVLELALLVATIAPALATRGIVPRSIAPAMLMAGAFTVQSHGWLLPWAGGWVALAALFALEGLEAAVRSMRAWRDALPPGFRGRHAVIDASVCFIDIERWTHRGERADPQALSDELARFLAQMDRIITVHGGHVDKYLGDGLMALFGLDGRAGHACRAVAAARACLAACDGPGAPHIAGEPVRLRAGIASGKVRAGDLGTGPRVHFTAIGDTVNVAARLEQLNRRLGTRLLVNERVVRDCPGHDWKPCGTVGIRGRDGALAAWTL